jgi:AcrR family transcriptional regulator
MTGVTRPYRGVSAQDRRTGRRAQLIEAALDLIGDEGLAATTMTAVCARAKLTERYFYESFKDLDELLVSVLDACVAEMDLAMYEALASSPPELLARCRAAAGAMIGVLTDDPRKARLHLEAVGSDALRARRAEIVRTHAAVLEQEMRELRGVEGPELKLATTVIIGGLADAISGWIDGSLAISRATLVEECARLAVAAADAVQATRP